MGYTDEAVQVFKNWERIGGDWAGWEELDLKSWLPQEATGVILIHYQLVNGTRYAKARKPGSSDTLSFSLSPKSNRALLDFCGVQNRKVEILHSSGEATVTRIIGYTREPIIFNDNLIDITPDESGFWYDTTVSPYVMDSTRVALVILKTDSGETTFTGVREDGTADNRSREVLLDEMGHGAFAKLNSQHIFETHIWNNSVYLAGYNTGKIYPKYDFQVTGLPFEVMGNLDGEDTILSHEEWLERTSSHTISVPEFATSPPLLHSEERIQSSSVSICSRVYSIRWSRKTFYANGRYWAFWIHRDGLDYWYYSTSTDGINWEVPINIRRPNYDYGETAGVFYVEETGKIHVHTKFGDSIFYRRGVPSASGTITWDEDEQEAWSDPGFTYKTDHDCSVNQDGYPALVWAYGINYSDIRTHVTKSTLNSGLWGTASGYPIELATDQKSVSGITYLPNDDWMVFMARGNEPIELRLYRSDDIWKPKVDFTSHSLVGQFPPANESWSWSYLTDVRGNIHFVYLDTSYNIWYLKWDYETSQWSDETLIYGSTVKHASPQVSIDEQTGVVYVFWCGSPTIDHIFYKRYIDGSWSNVIDWIDASSEELAYGSKMGESAGDDGVISVSRESNEGYITCLYLTGTISPFTLNHAALKTRTKKYKFIEWEDKISNIIRPFTVWGSTLEATYREWNPIELGDILSLVEFFSKVPRKIISVDFNLSDILSIGRTFFLPCSETLLLTPSIRLSMSLVRIIKRVIVHCLGRKEVKIKSRRD